MKGNCYDCAHAQQIEGAVKCEIHKFTTGKIFEVEKPKATCPSHSDRNIEEFRYMREGRFLNQASDVCCQCSKIVGVEYLLAEYPTVAKVSMSDEGDLKMDMSGARILCPDCTKEIDNNEYKAD